MGNIGMVSLKAGEMMSGKEIFGKILGSLKSITMFVYYLSSTLKHRTWSIFNNSTSLIAKGRFLQD